MHVRAAHINVADVSIGKGQGAISECPLFHTESVRDHDAVGGCGGSQQETGITLVKERHQLLLHVHVVIIMYV